MSNYNRLLLILTLLIVFFLFDSTKLNVRIEENPRQKFLDQYVKTEWDQYLWQLCFRNRTIWNPKHAYILFRETAWTESNRHDWAIEYKCGRIISRGRYQISKATYYMYRSRHNYKLTKNYKKHAHDKYINTMIFVWTMRLYYDIWGNFKQSLSSHNLGLTGFKKWKKRRNMEFYYYYIRKIWARLPGEYKNIL